MVQFRAGLLYLESQGSVVLNQISLDVEEDVRLSHFVVTPKLTEGNGLQQRVLYSDTGQYEIQ